MYFSNETQQDWRPGKREPDEAGGAFWLPGNVLLELHMVPPMSRGRDGDAEVTTPPYCFHTMVSYVPVTGFRNRKLSGSPCHGL